ncbi:MAG: GtrA family protein [Eubacterium sp.]|nr:GtrA family protein [Eubacterium sp.]
MKKSLCEIIKYFFFGVLSTILNYILFVIFIKVGIHYVISNIVTYGIAVIISFWLNAKFVFEDQNKARMQKLSKYIVNRIVLLTVENLMLIYLVETVKMSAEWAKLPIFIVLLVANYFISKFWIFN